VNTKFRLEMVISS